MDYLIYLDELNIIEMYNDDKEITKFLELDNKKNTVYIMANTKLQQFYYQQSVNIGYAGIRYPKITCPKNILYT